MGQYDGERPVPRNATPEEKQAMRDRAKNPLNPQRPQPDPSGSTPNQGPQAR
jgi:hypothetical protein